ncbi:MAG: S-adenosylmethionine:tRNA ribosyltransferase-isomerase [Bacteroidales bacterium]|jgi:S-adenosylmethionine:tRNA ribosyltransferase-isomerase|nr:S-adenosylmethionine:tRNA ribosyltransferase-isomerase [Bacteroidales bacterium]
MIQPRQLRIEDFSYELPAEKIAYYPLEKRDESKLLIWKEDLVRESVFKNIINFIPSGSRFIFNETRVFQARLAFKKNSGAAIEIFCLEPVAPYTDIERAFSQKEHCVWRCIVGNARKWKSGKIEWIHNNGDSLKLYAELIEREEATFLIKFSWTPESCSFSEVTEHCGNVPLPPYIRRKTEPADKNAYQTVYAREEGSVAAPTAGLHFTKNVLEQLEVSGMKQLKVVLHTGAGTFKPVSSETLADHTMHTEKLQISKKTVEELLKPVSGINIAVGTTTVRTLESLYWFGVKLTIEKRNFDFFISQWEVYDNYQNREISVETSLQAVLDYMNRRDLEQLYGSTGFMVVPGYKIRMADAILTNFHQPQSTLLLLVSAFTGDAWKEAYQYALQHDFRFLSYGDACLFFKKEV